MGGQETFEWCSNGLATKALPAKINATFSTVKTRTADGFIIASRATDADVFGNAGFALGKSSRKIWEEMW